MHFATCLLLALSAAGATTLSAQSADRFRETVMAGVGATKPVLADFDGDGDLDAVAASRTGATHFVNDGAGGLSPILIAVPGARGQFVRVADVDMDGDPDALLATDNGTRLLRNNSGVLTAEFLGTETLQFAELKDLDGDGDPDLVFAQSSTPLFAALNDGTGSFRFATNFLPVNQNVRDLVVGDVTGDGRPDVIVAVYFGMQLLVWTPAGYVDRSAQVAAFLLPTLPLRMQLVDVDRDGDLDVVSDSAGLQTYLNDGSGTFTRLPGGGSRVPGTISTADVDGDGFVDVVMADSDAMSPPVEIRRNDGSGRFSDVTASWALPGAAIGSAVGCGDLDGDRDTDFLIVDSLGFNTLRDERVWLQRTVDLRVDAAVSTGGALAVEVARDPGQAAGPLWALVAFGTEASVPLATPFGPVHVAPGASSLPLISLPAPLGAALHLEPVPADPTLVGLQVTFQGLFVDPAGAAPLVLTGLQRTVVQ